MSAPGETCPDVRAALDWAGEHLARAGVAEPRRDARLLLGEVMGGGIGTVVGHPERMLDAAQWKGFWAAVARRAAREPVSRILGRREFWSLEFQVTPATLDPRPDSETLVQAVLDRIPDRAAPIELLDLGTGTGCLLLALLSELPQATGLGVDIDPAAVAVARENATRLGLARRAVLRSGDWLDGLSGTWQVIVSNPPYIIERDLRGLAPEVVRYDPPRALSGGADGLAAYRRLIPQAVKHLAARGLLALEVGADQAEHVECLIAAAGLVPSGRASDLAGIDRCVLATR